MKSPVCSICFLRIVDSAWGYYKGKPICWHCYMRDGDVLLEKMPGPILFSRQQVVAGAIQMLREVNSI